MKVHERSFECFRMSDGIQTDMEANYVVNCAEHNFKDPSSRTMVNAG